MKKIFLDTNVILDLLLDREPFNDNIAEIIDQAVQKEIKLCVSSVTIVNTNYLIEKIEGAKSARQKTKKILELVYVDGVNESTVKKAAASKFSDYEDAVQNFCAEESNHRIIVTGDVKGFKKSTLSVLTPAEMLVKMNTFTSK